MRQFFYYLTKNQSAIRKFFVAAAAALGVLVVVWADGTITKLEWIEIAIAVLGALGVYGVNNDRTNQ